MTAKRKTPAISASKNDPAQNPDAKRERIKNMSKLCADGVLPLALIAEMFSRELADGDTDTAAIYDRLLEVGISVNEGKQGTMERLLFAQASTLNTMFAELTRRAALNMGQHAPIVEMYLRMALKAQAQSRATMQTLIEAKSPRAVAFVRQANIANQQQVNNGTAPPASRARAGEIVDPSNELLEDASHEQQWMDTRTAAAAARGNSEVATVGEQHRPAD